ncbi:MAG: Na+/H+ antiporter NhaA [Solirubrobacteraceae bacterium]|nr:Na+/H+ antiporter NhaA [Solirubrobacteraceae bacterium]
MSRASADAPSTPNSSTLRTQWTVRESRTVREFLATETGSAGLLLAATVFALVWANSPWSESYADVWHTDLRVALGGVGAIDLDLQHWVNDGLMALFFYVVGLEIRRELVLGELRDKRAAAIPAIAALAGMVGPALVYTLIIGGGEGARGWGIVMATDIAFVLGTLALLGNRIPPGVRVFLLTLAIVDDLGAIAVIAIFYSHGFSAGWFGVAIALIAIYAALLRFGPVWRGPAYFVAALLLWFATLESGIHPTIAGVVMGFLTAVTPPTRAEVERAASLTRLFRRSPSPETGREAVLQIGNSISANERFQHSIHPYTSYVVIPIFAIANAGVPLGGLGDALSSTVTLAVIAGLVLGKAIGVSAATLTAVRLRVGPLPTGVGRGHVGGAATLAGIGFTVSLFVTDLAFEHEALRDQAKIGVLAASLIAAVAGLSILAGRPRPVNTGEGRPLPLTPEFDPQWDRFRGPAEAPHTLVVFGDYECPYTRRLAPELARVLEQAEGAVRIGWRQLPNEARFPGTTLASEAALAAAAQERFWPMHDELLAHPLGDNLGPADLLDQARDAGLDLDRIADDLRQHVRSAAVAADVDSAARSGVPGTPTVFIDGERYDGPHSAEALLAAINASAERG